MISRASLAECRWLSMSATTNTITTANCVYPPLKVVASACAPPLALPVEPISAPIVAAWVRVLLEGRFCSFRHGTRRNSRSLFVTSINRAATACAAIQRSLFEIVSPFASSWARILP